MDARVGRGTGKERWRAKGRGRCWLVGMQCGVWASTLGRELRAEPFTLSADWSYQSSRSAGSELSENYKVDFVKHLAVTELMGLDVLLRYDRRSGRQETRQHVTPSLNYTLNNYLFSLNVMATDDEELVQDQGQRSNRMLSANWNSNWQKQLWLPAVTTNFMQTWEDDTFEPHLHEQETSNGNVRLDWDLGLARVFHSLGASENADFVTGTESQAESQQTRVETDMSFWSGRGSVTFAQQYATLDNDTQVRVEGGMAMVPVLISASNAESLVNPATLAGNALLADGDLETPALTVNNPFLPMNIGLRSNFLPVERLYLYTDTALSQGVASQFSWALYSSNNNLDWTLEQTAVAVSYNPVWERFEFFLPAIGKEFVKLVAVNDPDITAVNFTEVEAFRAVVTAAPSLLSHDTQENRQTDVGLTVQLRPNLQLTSAYGYQENTSSTSQRMDSTMLSSGLTWYPTPAWPVRLNSGLNTRNRGGVLNDETRYYGLSVGFPTIPAVESMAGVSLSRNEGLETLSNNINYSLQFIADLYTDLNARLNFLLSRGEDEFAMTDTDASSTQLQLTARLSPALLATWSGMYSTSSTQGPSVTSDARFNWRLTERFSSQGGVNAIWGEEDTANVYAGFDVLLTDTMQISFNQRRQISAESNNITSLDWRWTINQYISMMTSGAFLYGGGRDEWNITSRLNTRLVNF